MKFQNPLPLLGLAILVAGLLFSPTSARAQNLVQNPGFEDGNTSWTITNGPNHHTDVYGTLFGMTPHTGNAQAILGNYAFEGDGVFSQTIATTPGTVYDMSFWFQVANNGQQANNHLIVKFNGQTLFDSLNMPDHLWEQKSFAVQATGNQSVLSFGGYNNTGNTGLDDINVSPSASPVPEPIFYQMSVLLTLGGLGVLRHRRARRS